MEIGGEVGACACYVFDWKTTPICQVG